MGIYKTNLICRKHGANNPASRNFYAHGKAGTAYLPASNLIPTKGP
ncbi:hypothetical protein LEP1GSC202_0133 [Leptospira yanagawae serovar Saopaulo str. Sao Paulo = ATCC 700523]|uniref:Uncharacterized protein n=1 Tax=Leptospira yanagawae serovar Saopaulo str. Sao Paulo = ATCC 700523 TaxID=1249483 RepID=A0A5E8H7V6_9LEPT|nr:hypothetical protein LEP1GSC202_0133 [Leptospira yanagawae serovar Saopaulo str. Sao Paulo = ATCC 700523]